MGTQQRNEGDAVQVTLAWSPRRGKATPPEVATKQGVQAKRRINKDGIGVGNRAPTVCDEGLLITIVEEEGPFQVRKLKDSRRRRQRPPKAAAAKL